MAPLNKLKRTAFHVLPVNQYVTTLHAYRDYRVMSIWHPTGDVAVMVDATQDSWAVWG
jgi:hypothetical protein